MNRQAAVIEAAREACAILTGNHPAGDFADAPTVALETLEAALRAYDTPDAIDGGYAWNVDTAGGILLSDGDGRLVARIDSSAAKAGHERDEIAHNVAAALNLATFRGRA